jgi:hypothetical protein
MKYLRVAKDRRGRIKFSEDVVYKKGGVVW